MAKVYKNVLTCSGCEELYLNADKREKTADVRFNFAGGEENSVEILAHKNILSIISQAFYEKFYGDLGQCYNYRCNVC